MHDTRLEERLRQVLRAEGDSLPLTLTAGQLEQRLLLRRSERANRRLVLATAAALVLAVGAGGGFLLSSRATTPPVAASSSPSPAAASPSAPPSASPVASPSVSLAPVDDIAPYLGWQTLGRLNGPDDDSKSSLTAQRPSGVTVLLISAACSGSGSLAITAGDGEQLNVECPEASTDPARTLASAGDATEVTVDVIATGAVGFQVLVEGSNAPLAIPAVVLRRGVDEAALAYGCGGVISLAWGYDTSDSCATTLPLTSLATLELASGEFANVTIDGWTITDASATCGRITTAPDTADQFEAMTECTVIAELSDLTISVSGLPKAANPWVLELRLTARNAAGDSFSGPFYAYIFVR